MSSMLLPGRPPLTRARPSTSSPMTSPATRTVAKAPAALPLAGLAAAAAAAWLAARVLPGDEDNNEVRQQWGMKGEAAGRERERGQKKRERAWAIVDERFKQARREGAAIMLAAGRPTARNPARSAQDTFHSRLCEEEGSTRASEARGSANSI